MNLRMSSIAAALLGLSLCASAQAQPGKFEYRIYHDGLRAASGTVPAEPEEPALPAVPVGDPDPHWSKVATLMHMDAVSGAGPLDQTGKSWVGTNVALVDGGKFAKALSFPQANSWVEGPPINLKNDYTIEAWVNPSTASGFQPIIAQWSQASGQGAWVLALDNQVVKFKYGSIMPFATGGVVPTNTWTHVALVKYYSTYNIYVNGAHVGEFGITDYSTKTLTVNTTLGNFYASTGTVGGSGVTNFRGLMDEVRVTAGVARYLGAFTPPAVPFSHH